MSNYTVTASWALSNGMPVIGTWGGGDTNVYLGKQFIKSIDIEQVSVSYITVEKKKPKKIEADTYFTVELGGPFEQIGGDDEVIGSGSQKVGSANKQ